jgi:endonuclease YncB( thermonuclease family)
LFAIIRVALIDTPELPHTAQDKKLNDAIVEAQYKWGKAAKDAIASKVAETSKELKLTVTGFDSKYNRNIAAVGFSDGTDWGTYLVDRGLALVYTKYAVGVANYDALCLAQEKAKAQGLGFWSDPNFKEPSEFRKYKENLCK